MARSAVVGRIKQNILVEGRECWTLFDTGSLNNYVVEDFASLGIVAPLAEPRTTGLGDAVRRVEKRCMLSCRIQNRMLDVYALVLPEIGPDESDKRIEFLFGALEMQRWGIVPVPQEERIDMSHYPEMWVEYQEAIS